MTLERTDTTFDLSYKNITQKDGFFEVFLLEMIWIKIDKLNVKNFREKKL